MILATAWYHAILATLFSFAALALIGVILLQRGKGVGLSGAFGGAGGHTAFGAKTGDVLTWITIIGAIVVLAGAVILNYIFVPLTPFSQAATIAPAQSTAPPPETTTPAPGTATPADSGAPVEDTTTPGGTAPTPETEPPAETPPGGGEAPAYGWFGGNQASRPAFAPHDIFGEDFG